ncbi:MAG: PQQ-binding-like beta-propeller repeat protein, partial [Bythopirellula sp.]
MASVSFCAVVLLQVVAVGSANGADWPTARLNPQRNAFSEQPIEAALLEPAWVYRSSNPPSPAWHGPAKWDAYGDVRMHSMRNYDEVFQLIAVGSEIYFGSSVDDSVTSIDAATGRENWSYFTDGPVRIAPTFHSGKLYFGSDDGYAYCVNADDGKQIWKFRPQDPERLVINNGRFVPLLPVRSGVVVDGGVAYFAASLLPWKSSYLCAVDAESGSAAGEDLYVRELENMTFEGPLAISPRLV